MAGISNCRYCDKPIIWITRGNGSWHRPFDAPRELIGLDYTVSWDGELGDWMAQPVDMELTAKLVQHDCPKRTEMLAERREKLQAAQDARPAYASRRWPEESEPDEEIDRLNRNDYVPAMAIPTRSKLPERVVYRDPAPEKFIKIANQLKRRCPDCGAMPFHWCRFVDNVANQKLGRVGEESTRLHIARKDLG